ncbi:MAG: dihydroorotase [Fimbriimonas sp.]|nr:dihydroorotase [Fimbriimonas sp.]
MHFDLLVRNGTLFSPQEPRVGDIGIRGDKITAIGDLSGATANETLDAEHLIVLPGLIDTQVHFREPGLEHKEDLESGTRSALVGGVTSILEMPNTNPTTTTQLTLEDKLSRAAGRAWCHYGFFVGATTDNVEHLPELEMLPGTPGIKIFMGSSTGPLLVGQDDELRQVLLAGRKRCPIHAEDEPRNRERKALISSEAHAREHPFLRDAESARLATERILRLSHETGRPVHILHVSTALESPMIAKAKREGLGTTAEVTPQHLFFTAPDCYDRLGSLAQMNPPIRSSEHRDGLWQALSEGVFDVFGSDHAPHTLAEKSQPYPASPSGMPGVQTMLSVLLTFASQGRIGIETIVRMACEAPALIYGIHGKGRIEVGFDADLTLVDAKRSRVFERSMVQSKCGWSPYEGETLTGWVEHVVLNGRVAVREGQLAGSPTGRMLDFT